MKKLRVVSMVPSWTETLLHAGVDVVGRTRFCIHPQTAGSIPTVGGTKDFNPEEIAALRPDILLLDKEENVPSMAAAGFRVHCTHVQGTEDVPRELDGMAELFSAPKLAQLAGEWRTCLASPAYPKERALEIPGVLDWVKRPTSEPETFLYLIWRSPWMCVSRNTFVGAMLTQVGFGGRLPHFQTPYPKLDLGDYDPSTTMLLFSSEPYPFRAKKQELGALGFPAAIVDGEAYSWFGLRSLRFLQEQNS